MEYRPMTFYRLYYGCQGENQRNVADITSDDIAHGDHAFTFNGRYNADNQLRC